VKHLLLLLSLFCLCCVTSAKLDPSQPRTNYDQLLSAVKIGAVCVESQSDTSEKNGDLFGWWNGSGVIVSGHHVLTAFHVIHCENSTRVGIYAKLWDDTIVEMKVTKTDEDADLALLETYNGKLLGVDIVPPVIGKPDKNMQECAVFAYPKRDVACGTTPMQQSNMMYFTQNVIHGNSGSPIYNRHGELLGLVDELVGDEDDPKGGMAVTLWNNMGMLPNNN
jgi:S1-C subfamily serine protease